MSIVLGLAPGGIEPSMRTPFHDSSAALVDSGRLQALMEEERPTRIKRALGMPPSISIALCLEHAGIELSDIDAIAVGWRLDDTERAHAQRRIRNWLETALPGSTQATRTVPEIHFVGHHYAHACCGYFASGFPSAAGVVIDGRSEREAISIWACRGDEVELVRQWPRSASLGRFYAAATRWTGLGRSSEGKFMGLAAYGKAGEFRPAHRTREGFTYPGFTYYDAPTRDYRSAEYRPNVDQGFILRHREHLAAQFATMFPYERGDGSEIMAYSEFAASVQASLEDAMGGLVDLALRETGENRIFLAGGVALNCSMNGRVAREFPGIQLYVPPVPHDAGVSYGAALAQRPHEAMGGTRLDHAFFGYLPSQRECVAAVDGSGLPYEAIGDDVRGVAEALANGAVVGWFDGRAEIGQRALGSRSILADPRRRSMTTRVNRIKGRELWRPLAPSVLARSLNEYFEVPSSATHLTKFMLGAVNVKRDKQRHIAACTHIDGTARPQAVTREIQPRYWALLSEFESLTGVPVLLNTSFNLAGEPIVHSAMDAVSVFERSDLDALVIGDFLLRKKP